MQQMWEKWVLLASGGALTCLLRGNAGEIEAAGGAQTALRIVAETASVAEAAGYQPSQKFRTFAEKMLTAPGSSFATSMYRDMTGGLPVEGEHIVGDMVRRAEAASLDTPLLAAAATALRIYMARRQA